MEAKIKALAPIGESAGEERWSPILDVCLLYERYLFVCGELSTSPASDIRAQLVSHLRVCFLEALQRGQGENDHTASSCLEWSLRLAFQKDLIEWIKEKWIAKELSHRIQKQAFLAQEQEYLLKSFSYDSGLVPAQRMVQSISRWILDSHEWRSLRALLDAKNAAGALDTRREEFKFTVLKYTFEYVVQLLLAEIPLIFTLSGSTRYFHSVTMCRVPSTRAWS